MGDLRSRHLEGAVAAEDERAESRADLGAERARHPEAHRRVVPLRQVSAVALHPDVEAREQHVARFRDDGIAAPAAEEAIHLVEHVGHAEAARDVRGGGREVVAVPDALAVPPQTDPEEAAHEVANVHVGVGVEARVDPPADGPDRAVTRDARRPAAEIHVGEERAEVQHQVGTVHPVDDRARADRPDVDAHVERMVHWKGALGEDGRGDGSAHPFGERPHLALQLEAEGLDADHGERPARGVEALGRLADRLLDLPVVRPTKGERAVPLEDLARHGNPALHHVAVDLQVAGLLFPPDSTHDVVHALGRRARVVEHPCGAGELLVDAVLRLDLLGLMVDEHAEAPLLLARPAADHEHRHALRERARHRVHHVVAARAVRDTDDGETSGGARISVGREPDARLVGQRDDPEGPPAAEAEKETDHEVARDAEEVGHTDLCEVGDEKVAERHRGAHRLPRRRTPRRCPTRPGPSAPDVRGRPGASPRRPDDGARGAGRRYGGRALRRRPRPG